MEKLIKKLTKITNCLMIGTALSLTLSVGALLGSNSHVNANKGEGELLVKEAIVSQIVEVDEENWLTSSKLVALVNLDTEKLEELKHQGYQIKVVSMIEDDTTMPSILVDGRQITVPTSCQDGEMVDVINEICKR